jgi:dienelactone hydrolase
VDGPRSTDVREIEAVLDGVSPTLLAPDDTSDAAKLVLWLTHLGGSAQKERPTMTALVKAGHPVVSFDPPLHGRRASTDDAWGFAAEVLASFRRRMWPILGQATLEAMRVISWAQEQLDRPDQPVAAGGVSMGGDIAVALAGIDDRVHRVATVGSTPNWQRPGMRSLNDPSKVVDQGEADRYAQWYADQLDPSQHVDRYLTGVDIAFESGGDDQHIPASNAEEFRRAVLSRDESAASRIQIRIHEGLDHLGVTTSTEALGSAISWLGRGSEI